jgi:translation elongation factor P
MSSYSTSEFKSGLKILLDGEPFSIVENEMVKPGKGQAFNRVKIRNLKNGKVTERTWKAGDSVEAADVVDADMQFLFSEGDFWTFMLPDTFEQYTAGKAAMGDAAQWLKDGVECIVTLWNGQPLPVAAADQARGDGFQARGIAGIEAADVRAVEVEHSEQPARARERHHDLRIRGGIAGNVAGKGVHVVHQHRPALGRGRPAHPLADRDAHARGLALERADDEPAAVVQIEPRPVEVRQRPVEQRGGVGEVGDQVALAREQPVERRQDRPVARLGTLMGRTERHRMAHHGLLVAALILRRPRAPG